MLIVDLRHWLLPDGNLAPQVRLAPDIAMIVECATSGLGDGVTAMTCRHRTRRRCVGRVGVATEGDAIKWSCGVCDDAGVIAGWRGTRWNLSDIEIAPDDDELGLYVPFDELRELRALDLPSGLRAALASAPAVGERHACVALTEGELTDIVAALTEADVGGAARRRLDRTLGRAEQTLVAHQLARRSRAH